VGTGSWCPGESAVAGEQGGVHRFGECHVGRVMDGEVVPWFQHRGSGGRCGARWAGGAADRPVRGLRAGC
jgi:hypothetical protein